MQDHIARQGATASSTDEGLRIPLRRRDGTIQAYALIDACDAPLAANRWYLTNTGYAARNLPLPGGQQRTGLLHRELLGLTPGDGVQCDHYDRDRLNCRRSNLRVVTHAQNAQNRASVPGSSSPYRGVSWDARSGKWKAEAELNGMRYNLGRFYSEQEAAAVARDWRLTNMPFAVDAS